MCDQHSTDIVMTRKAPTHRWCLRHEEVAGDSSCRRSPSVADWCHVTDVEVWHPVAVDHCIAPIVDALNKAGVFTVASCCGHGADGRISLRDGREVVLTTFERAQEVWGIVMEEADDE